MRTHATRAEAVLRAHLRGPYLRAAGLRVLRLANEQVLVDLESTLKLIALALLPLSASGEGAGG